MATATVRVWIDCFIDVEVEEPWEHREVKRATRKALEHTPISEHEIYNWKVIDGEEQA